MATYPQRPRHPRNIRRKISMTPLRRAALKVANRNPKVASKIKRAIRASASAEEEDRFAVGPVDHIKRMIMRYPNDTVSFEDLYKGNVPDIDLYIAFADLVREGKLSGPDPYRDRFRSHKDLVYQKLASGRRASRRRTAASDF